jgi:uroporphyrinogen-III synthase
MDRGFLGKRVLCLESRRSPELAILVMNYGGRPVIAPALHEVPLESNVEAMRWAAAMIRGDCDVLLLLTGVGTRALMRVTEPVYGREAMVRALGRIKTVARGPKSVAALRELGLSPWVAVPKPNTWRELVAAIDEQLALSGLRVAVQEYGVRNQDLELELQSRGAFVMNVPVYRWCIPDDRAPLRAALRALIGGEIDVVMLTTGVQLTHLLQVAAESGVEREARAALSRTVIASIGPMTTEEVERQGLTPDFVPTNAKMGFLVKEAAERCGDLLRSKRVHTA